MEHDRRHMGHALGLARRGLGRVWPNPAVGCVIVKDGRVVARARTADGGRPHAETQALEAAGAAARGATVYVTLEPCAHEGETPSCARLLAEAGVARVVIATGDPDARTAGQGIARLRAAGVTVETGVMEAEAREVNAGFLSRIEHGRPFVTLKLATTLDGRIATASGESRWITGPEARRVVHAMRARHDAVMVGAGTVRADDPTLTVRDMGVTRQPVRVVLSRHLALPFPGRLGETIDEAPLWLVHGPRASEGDRWRDTGARLIEAEVAGGHLAVSSVLAALGREGLTRVFCEGGGTLAASLLAAGLVDELALFTAGAAIGAEGQPGLGALGIAALADAPRLRLTRVARVGADSLSIWRA